ncbi:MAG: DUF6526 family protein [Thermoanaerobaculia bacterium]
MPTNAPMEQNFANHTQNLPPLYMAAFLVLAANLLWSLWTLIRFPTFTTALAVLTAFAILVVGLYARTNAQIVQNRLIRLEERLRLANILPADLKARIGELSTGQLIALRFASDGEVTELVREVLAGDIQDKKVIKAKIRSWRADFLRV